MNGVPNLLIYKYSRATPLKTDDTHTHTVKCSESCVIMSYENLCTTAKCTKIRGMKITVVGDGCVGKTCVLYTYKKKEFPKEYVPTVFDNYPDNIVVDGQEYEICLWDTAGSEDYTKIRPLTYPGTKCFLLCFAVDDQHSFENILSKWYPELKNTCRAVPVILVGTKSDLRETEVECISKREAMKMKKKIKAASYIECSALRKENVDEIFQEAVRVIIRRQNSSKLSCLKIPLSFYQRV